MFDARLRPIIDPPLNALGQKLASIGASANLITVCGLFLGLVAALAIVSKLYILGMVFLIASRLCDGLDGAVARATQKTDFGGLLDIVFDFFFYGMIPLAFVLADPAANAVAGAVLLFAFYANGASFLAYAIIAEKRNLTTTSHGSKTLYYTGGLAEAAETIAVFIAFCLFPQHFSTIALVFSGICAVTTASRMILAHQIFTENEAEKDTDSQSRAVTQN